MATGNSRNPPELYPVDAQNPGVRRATSPGTTGPVFDSPADDWAPASRRVCAAPSEATLLSLPIPVMGRAIGVLQLHLEPGKRYSE